MRNYLQVIQPALNACLAEESSVAIIAVDARMVIKECNRGFLKIFSLETKPLGRPLGDFLLISEPSGMVPGREWKLQCTPRSGVSGALAGYVFAAQDDMVLLAERLMLTDSSIVGQMTLLTNELVNKERELSRQNKRLSLLREELSSKVAELEATLARVRQLEGIIPICMHCKKIRDDQDVWHRLEEYFADHSDVLFSHGLCPGCLQLEYEKIRG